LGVALVGFSALVAGLVGPVSAGAAERGAAVPTGQQHRALSRLGTTSLSALAAARPRASGGGSRGPAVRAPRRTANRGTAAPKLVLPNPRGSRVVTSNPGFRSFSALTHRDQRFASDGNQFDLEPPDQGLCVGNGHAVEMVNAALSVYDTNGNVTTPTVSLNDFYGLAPNIRRDHNPPTFGPFVFDPVCHYDAGVNRWFLVAAEIDLEPFTGDFGRISRTLLAVSQTGDPNGSYGLFAIDSTDEGGPGCPCFGDFPKVGADANGFYITTNEFSISGPEFNGAQIDAVSKRGIAAAASGGPLPTLVHIAVGRQGEGISGWLAAATPPPGGRYPPNREYFLSPFDFNGAGDNRIAVWALNNTSSLANLRPNLSLSHAVIRSEVYAFPPVSRQKDGFRPLGQSVHEPVGVIDPGAGDAFTQVFFQGGLLWGSMATAVGPPGGPYRAGLALMVVRPTFSAGRVGGSVVRQGYLAVDGQNLIFPSLAVNVAGRALVAFNLVGPRYFPSQAYAWTTGGGVGGDVHLATPGVLPLDQRTCYEATSGDPNPVCRFGDYSWTTVDRGGRFWFGNEFVDNQARTEASNWATVIGRVVP
jgi:hypothetical protein